VVQSMWFSALILCANGAGPGSLGLPRSPKGMTMRSVDKVDVSPVGRARCVSGSVLDETNIAGKDV